MLKSDPENRRRKTLERSTGDSTKEVELRCDRIVMQADLEIGRPVGERGQARRESACRSSQGRIQS